MVAEPRGTIISANTELKTSHKRQE